MKKVKIIIAAIFIVAVGAGIFWACKKENIDSKNSTNNKTIAIQKTMGGGDDEECDKYYQWRACALHQDEKCYLGNTCNGPFPNPISPSCNCPGVSVFSHDENGHQIEVDCGSPFYPFTSQPYNGMTWNVELSKEYIAENYWFFQDAYNRGMLNESPQDLYNNAPYRTDAGFSYEPNIIDLVPPINIIE